MEAAGGPVVTPCDAAFLGPGTWSKDDVILFTPARGPLFRVSASGGTPAPVTTLDADAGDVQHWYPWFLPDGRHFLYFVVGSKPRGVGDPRAVHVGSLDENEPARLRRPSHRRGADRRPGHDGGGRRVFGVGCAEVVMAPDGARAAVSVMDPAEGTRDIWLFNVDRGIRERFTFGAGDDLAPTWSRPDGDRIIFSSSRGGSTHLYQKALRDAGSETVLFEDDLGKYASSVSADGQYLAYVAGGGIIRRSDVWALPLTGHRRPLPLLQTPFLESQPQFSPDGQWLAYMGNESGRYEVSVRPFGREGETVLVTVAGGGWPRWRRDGKELFYLATDGAPMEVPIDTRRDRVNVGVGRCCSWCAPARRRDSMRTTTTSRPTASGFS